MGHKVHPYGFRLGISRTWSAKWYADKDYRTLLQEDLAIRKLIDKRLATASVSGVEIERGINYVARSSWRSRRSASPSSTPSSSPPTSPSSWPAALHSRRR